MSALGSACSALPDRLNGPQLTNLPAEATAAGAMAATWDQSQLSDQKIKAPVLAVYAGTRPLATEQAVKTLYPEADYYTIPETAHFLMMEKPIEFNRMLLKFVEKFK